MHHDEKSARAYVHVLMYGVDGHGLAVHRAAMFARLLGGRLGLRLHMSSVLCIESAERYIEQSPLLDLVCVPAEVLGALEPEAVIELVSRLARAMRHHQEKPWLALDSTCQSLRRLSFSLGTICFLTAEQHLDITTLRWYEKSNLLMVA